MINNKPVVTVLMSVYNGERYLREAIESILKQTFTDFEYLIIDDGSTDASSHIIRSYCDSRIKLVENLKNLGLIKSLNRGLALARGEYVARQDADDISHPTRLEKQVAFLNSHPEIVILGTRVNSIDPQGRKSKPYGCCIVSSELAIRWQLMFDNPFVHSSVMMRTGIVRNIGGYDEHFLTCEDYELFSRLVYAYRATNLKEVLLDYRYHSGSVASKCTKKNNLLMGDIMLRNFKAYIGVEPRQESIELWLGMSNPYNFNTTVDVEELLRYINLAYSKFISIYPLARSDQEIRRYMAHMLIRISYNAALKDRFASICCFCRVFKRDILLACRFLPKYLVAIILGSHKTFVSKKFRKYCDIIGMARGCFDRVAHFT